MFSCHSHSGQYCHHAHGTLEQLVQKAIEKGFKSYCLTEHMPRSREKDLYPEEKEHFNDPSHTMQMYRDFYQHAKRLQTQFKNDIHLLVGFESEWIYSGSKQVIKKTIDEFPPDIIVGSVHHVFEFPLDFDLETFEAMESWVKEQPPSFAIPYLDSEEQATFVQNGVPNSHLISDTLISPTELIFRAYFDAQYELLTTIHPLIVGHFDLCRLFRPDHPLSKQVWARIRRNLDLIADYGGILELNSRAYKKSLPSAYPFRDIVHVVLTEYKNRNIRFTCSDDSHGWKDVGMAYSRLSDYVTEMGIQELYYPLLDLGNEEGDVDFVESFLQTKGSSSIIIRKISTSDPDWISFMKG